MSLMIRLKILKNLFLTSQEIESDDKDDDLQVETAESLEQ